jgi:galactose mutarotase-like enzyme
VLKTLKNNDYELVINSFGAELKSSKYKNEEYLHIGDDAYWKRSSLVLFPIIGKLKNNNYKHNNKNYSLPIHGLARHREFKLIEQSPTSLAFLLKDDENSLKHYPFKFNLTIKYILEADSFSINYEVSSSEDILFSLGAHPAFLLKDDINNSYLEFNKHEKSDLLCLDINNGCIASRKKDYLNSNLINLNTQIFKDDALIFENLKSNSVSLKNSKNSKSINVIFDNFSHMGFWAPVNAPFVCIEPWCGIADYSNTNYNFEEKIGIIKLEKNKAFSRSISISFK